MLFDIPRSYFNVVWKHLIYKNNIDTMLKLYCVTVLSYSSTV